MTLYLIHGNVYYDGYGHIEQLYEKEKHSNWSDVEDISDIEVEVVEIESDMAVDITLGGYCE